MVVDSFYPDEKSTFHRYLCLHRLTLIGMDVQNHLGLKESLDLEWIHVGGLNLSGFFQLCGGEKIETGK